VEDGGRERANLKNVTGQPGWGQNLVIPPSRPAVRRELVEVGLVGNKEEGMYPIANLIARAGTSDKNMKKLSRVRPSFFFFFSKGLGVNSVPAS
jgi:hypothetical protein